MSYLKENDKQTKTFNFHCIFLRKFRFYSWIIYKRIKIEDDNLIAHTIYRLKSKIPSFDLILQIDLILQKPSIFNSKKNEIKFLPLRCWTWCVVSWWRPRYPRRTAVCSRARRRRTWPSRPTTSTGSWRQARSCGFWCVWCCRNCSSWRCPPTWHLWCSWPSHLQKNIKKCLLETVV